MKVLGKPIKIPNIKFSLLETILDWKEVDIIIFDSIVH